MFHRSLIIWRKLCASVLVSTTLSVSLLSAPSFALFHQKLIPIDQNPDVEDQTSVPGAVKDVKEFLIKREPPFEPFFIRAAWGSENTRAKVDWKVTVTSSHGRLFVRRMLDPEQGDSASRATARFASGMNIAEVTSQTGIDNEVTGYDGVELIFRKPVTVPKDQIKFTFKAGDTEIIKTMKELQEEPYRENTITMGDVSDQTLYLDVINFDTKRGAFGKGRMELIFLSWGNVANIDMKLQDEEDVEDATRNYVVTIGLENPGDSKLNYLATVGMEQGINAQLDNVIITENKQQVTVTSSIVGGVDQTDMIVLALQGTFEPSEIPFQQRGITVRAAEILNHDNFVPAMPAAKAEEKPAPEKSQQQKQQKVTMTSTRFNPQDITVPLGTKVVWSNTSSIPHTVTFNDAVDSGNMNAGAQFERVFDKAGSYPYVCRYHESIGMVGTVTVTPAVSSSLLAQEGKTVTGEPSAAETKEEPAVMEGDVNADGVLDDSAVTIEKSIVEEELEKITHDATSSGENAEQVTEEETPGVLPPEEKAKVGGDIFAKTFWSTEQFGVYDFDDDSGYGLRIVNGSFLWNNTPTVMKALLLVNSIQALSFYLSWIANPSTVIALAGLGVVTAAYMAQVQTALFGETTLSQEGMDKLLQAINKQVQQIKTQLQTVVQQGDGTQEVIVDEEAVDEVVTEITEAADEVETVVSDIESSPDEAQSCYEEGICPFADVPQNIVQSGTVVATWFKDYVRLAVQRGLVSGFKDAAGKPTGAFHPEQNVLMAQTLKVALLANDLNFVYDESKNYPGVCEGKWYCTYVAACEQYYSDSPLCDIANALPNFPANRGEVAGFMIGMAGLIPEVDCSTQEEKAGIACFPDSQYSKTYPEVNGTSVDYQGYIEHLHVSQCVSGVGDTGKYVPEDLITRAAFAKIANCVAEQSGVEEKK